MMMTNLLYWFYNTNDRNREEDDEEEEEETSMDDVQPERMTSSVATTIITHQGLENDAESRTDDQPAEQTEEQDSKIKSNQQAEEDREEEYSDLVGSEPTEVILDDDIDRRQTEREETNNPIYNTTTTHYSYQQQSSIKNQIITQSENKKSSPIVNLTTNHQSNQNNNNNNNDENHRIKYPNPLPPLLSTSLTIQHNNHTPPPPPPPSNTNHKIIIHPSSSIINTPHPQSTTIMRSTKTTKNTNQDYDQPRQTTHHNHNLLDELNILLGEAISDLGGTHSDPETNNNHHLTLNSHQRFHASQNNTNTITNQEYHHPTSESMMPTSTSYSSLLNGVRQKLNQVKQQQEEEEEEEEPKSLSTNDHQQQQQEALGLVISRSSSSLSHYSDSLHNNDHSTDHHHSHSLIINDQHQQSDPDATQLFNIIPTIDHHQEHQQASSSSSLSHYEPMDDDHLVQQPSNPTYDLTTNTLTDNYQLILNSSTDDVQPSSSLFHPSATLRSTNNGTHTPWIDPSQALVLRPHSLSILHNTRPSSSSSIEELQNLTQPINKSNSGNNILITTPSSSFPQPISTIPGSPSDTPTMNNFPVSDQTDSPEAPKSIKTYPQVISSPSLLPRARADSQTSVLIPTSSLDRSTTTNSPHQRLRGLVHSKTTVKQSLSSSPASSSRHRHHPSISSSHSTDDHQQQHHHHHHPPPHRLLHPRTSNSGLANSLANQTGSPYHHRNLISRSSHSRGASIMEQWQWLESSSSLHRSNSTVAGKRPSLISILGRRSESIKPATTHFMGTTRQRETVIKKLDEHFRSMRNIQDTRYKMSRLIARQEQLNVNKQKMINMNNLGKSSRTNHQRFMMAGYKEPPIMSYQFGNKMMIESKQIKKVKTSVERCKIYSERIKDVRNEKSGIDLWIWMKSKNNEVIIRKQIEDEEEDMKKIDGLKNFQIGGHSRTYETEEEEEEEEQIHSIEDERIKRSDDNQRRELHTREGSRSSVISFPIRGVGFNNKKAIEINEKKIEREESKEEMNKDYMKKLIEVEDLPFPGLYEHSSLSNGQQEKEKERERNKIREEVKVQVKTDYDLEDENFKQIKKKKNSSSSSGYTNSKRNENNNNNNNGIGIGGGIGTGTGTGGLLSMLGMIGGRRSSIKRPSLTPREMMITSRISKPISNESQQEEQEEEHDQRRRLGGGAGYGDEEKQQEEEAVIRGGEAREEIRGLGVRGRVEEEINQSKDTNQYGDLNPKKNMVRGPRFEFKRNS